MCVKAFSIIPEIMISSIYLGVNWQKPFIDFVQFFHSDMPCIGSIKSELDIWCTYWTEHFNDILPDTVIKTLKVTDKQSFPNIFTGLKILAVMPITTCECERTISTMRRLKTYTRSTMGQDRMNGLAMLNIHKEVEVSSDEVLDEFARISRRIDL